MDEIQNDIQEMKNIYDSIKDEKIFEKHINSNKNQIYNFLKNYPYENPPNNNSFVFNNLCMFNDLSSVNGYFYTSNGIKIIDFTANYKLNDGINLTQRCLLPERLFHLKYSYKNPIKPLPREKIKPYLIY